MSMASLMNRHRMAVLLGTMICLILASPVADVMPRAGLLIAGATMAFLLSCLHQVDDYPRLRILARLIVVLWMGSNFALKWVKTSWPHVASALLLATLSPIIVGLVLKHLVSARRVDAELLCSAIGAYLLLGVFWTESYEVLSLVVPSSFIASDGSMPNKSALLYFSFTTLTTTGYGDITALNPVVRMWAVVEAVVGTIYNATVVARLVSLYGGSVDH